MQKKTILLLIIAGIIVLGAGYFLFQYFNRSSGNEPTRTQNSEQTPSITTVARNLAAPWSVVFYEDTPLVSSRDTGEIFELANDGSSRSIGTVQDAVHQGEGGLLGLAVDDQSRLYAYYTTANDNRISRLSVSGEAGGLALTGTPEVIVEGIPKASNHNGGRIAFGPDGYLYATIGDASTPDLAQDTASLAGKILRMTVDGEAPADNPYPNSLVYSYGHRNPQGIAWDDAGVMYASEFGQNTWDELNVIEPGGNYGWPLIEGIEERDGFIAPVQQWATREASPSGMAYADGVLYIANLRGTVLRGVPVEDLSASYEYFEGEYGRIRDVVTAPDERIWFLTNNTDGRGLPGGEDDRIISVPVGGL